MALNAYIVKENPYSLLLGFATFPLSPALSLSGSRHQRAYKRFKVLVRLVRIYQVRLLRLARNTFKYRVKR